MLRVGTNELMPRADTAKCESSGVSTRKAGYRGFKAQLVLGMSFFRIGFVVMRMYRRGDTAST